MNELKDKKILGIEVSKGEEYIRFTLENHPPIIYQATGDCYSESWFADIIGVNNLLGEIVREVEVISVRDISDDRTRQEYDVAYGYKFTTGFGISEIIYRNSSNGYYGGSLSFVNSFPEDIIWKKITSDFSF